MSIDTGCKGARATAVRTAAAVFAAWSVSIALIAPVPASAEELSNDWRFSATLYGWLPDIAGKTTFPAGGTDIKLDFGTILDYLQMAGQGSFSMQKGSWGAYTDLIYLDVGASKSQTRNLAIGGRPLPAGVTAAMALDLKAAIWTLGGSYRLITTPEQTFDVLAGARLAATDQKLNWTFTGNFGPIEPPPMSGSSSTSIRMWDAIIGAKGRLSFGNDRKWAMPYYFDIGTGDSDLTWQALVGASYSFGWGDLSVAWRYLDYQLKSGSPVADLSFNGPAVGATWRW